jgi:murein L,D-transpeptidase YcbB/YkuD
MRRHVANLRKSVFAVIFLLSLSCAAQQAQRTILVSIPDRKLAVIENGGVLKTYSVAVGAAESPSPTGEFTVTNRLENPTYYRPGVIIEPGPQNPLGTRWIGLNQKGYGIHGTNAPSSIGKAASHGCIRMARTDLEELFTMVRVGDMVKIEAERDEEVASVFGTSASTEHQQVTVAANHDATASEEESEPATR